jgi:uncharacterized cysteine cluster protein YcgN (CxxCxxCC family)
MLRKGVTGVKPTDDPEILCLRCGRCCYAKEQRADGLYISKIPCPYLDTSTKLCRVYDTRSGVPWCCDPVAAIKRGEPVLPTDCPLAKRWGPPGYVGPKEDK